jgi:DNA-binding response OmpR family regulator
VVVVDDDSDDAEFLAFVAQSNVYDVRIASDGIEALAVIEEHEPHRVLLILTSPPFPVSF